MSDLASRLKECRLKYRESQSVFAKRIGLPLRTIQGYESGERTPGADALAAYADTGVDLNWLILGPNDQIGPRIRMIRNYYGSSLERFSDLTSIPVEDLKNYESGLCKPTTEDLKKIINNGISEAWLLRGLGDMGLFKFPKEVYMPEEIKEHEDFFVIIYHKLSEINEKKRLRIIMEMVERVGDAHMVEKLQRKLKYYTE